MGVFCALDPGAVLPCSQADPGADLFPDQPVGHRPGTAFFAAIKYALFMPGGIPLLFAILLLGSITPAPWGVDPRRLSFDYLTLLEQPLSPSLQTVIFLLLFFGFAVKAPLFPFHTWLPTVLREGPVALSAVGGPQARRVRHPALCLPLARLRRANASG